MVPVRTVGLADTSLRSLVNLSPPAQASLGSLLDVLHSLDSAGLRSIDAWGSMTFDHCLRHLEESPWDRLRGLASHITETPLRMHLRGRCLLGFRPYPWSIVEAFLREAADCGVRSFVVFEPLNDLDSLERIATAVRAAGSSLSLGLVHNTSASEPTDSVSLAGRLAEFHPDSLCVKTAGTLGPRAAGDLVAALREATPLSLEIDFDNGGGLATSAAVAAVQAGADVIHCSATLRGFNLSGVPLLHLLPALFDAGMNPEPDVDALAEVCGSFAALLSPGCATSTGDPHIARAAADFRALAPVPGDLFRQVSERLEERGALARLAEVMTEMARVHAEIGKPELAAPLGQVVATQAILNVLYGARWHVVPDEMKALLRGEYGTIPAPVNGDVIRAVLGEKTAGDAPYYLEPPSLEDSRAALGSLASSTGDALLSILAPDAATAFLEKRTTSLQVDLTRIVSDPAGPRGDWEDEWHDLGPDRVRELVTLLEASTVEEVTVENKGTRVTVRKASRAAPESFELAPAGGAAPTAGPGGDYMPAVFSASSPEEQSAANGREVICASMVGTFYRSSGPESESFVDVGQHVDSGDVLCVLEAMKLMNEMVADSSGTIAAILVEDGMAVEYGQPLFLLDADN